MLAAHLRVDGLDLGLRLRDRRSHRQSSDDEVAPRATYVHLIIGKREWFPNLRSLAELAAVAEIEELKRKIKTGGHHADNRETFAVQKKLLPHDLRIVIEPALPKTRTKNNDIVATDRAFFRLKESAFDGRNTEQRQHACGHARARNALGSIFAGKIETRITKRPEFFKTVRARFVIDHFRRRNGKPLEILRFEMLQKQDELLRISVGERSKEQRIYETQHGGSRADR